MKASADHGRVHVFGSSTVYSYLIVVALTSVNRSVIFRFSVDLWKLVAGVLSLKFAVWTTSVLPSQCPREMPSHARTVDGGSGRPSNGTIRTSEPDCVMIEAYPGDCRIWISAVTPASLPVVFTGSGFPPRTSGPPAALPVMHRV